MKNKIGINYLLILNIIVVTGLIFLYILNNRLDPEDEYNELLINI